MVDLANCEAPRCVILQPAVRDREEKLLFKMREEWYPKRLFPVQLGSHLSATPTNIDKNHTEEWRSPSRQRVVTVGIRGTQLSILKAQRGEHPSLFHGSQYFSGLPNRTSKKGGDHPIQKLHSVDEGHVYVGVCRTKFYELLNNGQIHAARSGTYVESQEIERFIWQPREIQAKSTTSWSQCQSLQNTPKQ